MEAKTNSGGRPILPDIPPERVLTDALKEDLRHVVVVGVGPYGNIYVSSSMGSIEKAIGFLVRAQHFLARILNSPTSER